MTDKPRKRRPRGGVGITKRGNKYEATYRIPKEQWREGEPKTVSAHGITEAEAQSALLVKLAGANRPAPKMATASQEQEVRTWLGADGKDIKGARQPKLNSEGGTTLEQWANEWLTTWLGGVQASTRDIYVGHLRHYILPYLGHYELNALSTKVLKEKWWDPITALRKTRGGAPTDEPKLAASARGNVYRTLRMVITTAHYKLGTRVSLTERLIPIPEVNRPESDREIKQIAKLLREKLIDNPDRSHPLWPLFAMTMLGLRQSERLGIRVSDIDLTDPTDQVILIHGQLDFRKDKGGWYWKESLKNGEPRSVPLWGIFLEAIQQQMDTRKKWQKSREWNPDPKFADLLFLQPNGDLITRKQENPEWDRLIGVDVRGHAARHATGYLLAEDGISVETAKILLGHKSDAMATYYRIASTRQAHAELTKASTKRRNSKVINFQQSA